MRCSAVQRRAVQCIATQNSWHKYAHHDLSCPHVTAAVPRLSIEICIPLIADLCGHCTPLTSTRVAFTHILCILYHLVHRNSTFTNTIVAFHLVITAMRICSLST